MNDKAEADMTASISLKEWLALKSQHAELLAACKSVAGVFQDFDDKPIYAQKCICAVEFVAKYDAATDKETL